MPQKAAKNKKPDASEGSREKILAAARKEFTEFGDAGARVDNIARRAGVNKAMIYYHFSSKEKLYQAVMDSFITTIADRVKTVMEGETDLRTLLLGISETWLRIFSENPAMPRLLLRELADPKSKLIPRLARQMSQSGIPASMRSFLTAGVKSGKLREIDIRQAFVSFLTMNVGYYLMSPFIDRVMDIDDRKSFIAGRPEATVDLFLNGVMAE